MTWACEHDVYWYLITQIAAIIIYTWKKVREHPDKFYVMYFLVVEISCFNLLM